MNSNNGTKELAEMVIDKINKFRGINEIYGYNTEKVSTFFDGLIDSILMFGTDKESNNYEYTKDCNIIINTIEKVLFTQGFRGYDTAEVDKFLDRLINKVSQIKDPENTNDFIDTDDIKMRKFSRGFRGYDFAEVDSFMRMIAEDIENVIKKTQIY